jgi:hypothetical protein
VLGIRSGAKFEPSLAFPLPTFRPIVYMFLPCFHFPMPPTGIFLVSAFTPDLPALEYLARNSTSGFGPDVRG